MLTAGEWAEARLGYAFGDPTLLDAALTHRSAGKHNYERLEFLGDAVLNCAIAHLLFAKNLKRLVRAFDFPYSDDRNDDGNDNNEDHDGDDDYHKYQ